MELFESMQKYRLTPNVITYNASISTCEKGVRPERAVEFFESMQTYRLTPNVITYNASISMCEKGVRPGRA